MKLRIYKNTIAVFMIIGVLSCGRGSQNDCDKLNAENQRLKKEIFDLKFGAGVLYKNVEAYLDSGDFRNAKINIDRLLVSHPLSEEAKKAKPMEDIINKGIDSEKLLKIKQEKDRLSNATKNMWVKVDDINDITIYRDKSSPRYVNYNGFYASIRDSKEMDPLLILHIQYVADDWLFINGYQIKVDGVSYSITENGYGEIKSDNGDGEIWEWLTRTVGASEYEIIKAIAYGKEVKIRFNGKDYNKDKIINESQKLALRNVLNTFEALGGKVSIFAN
jgi:hypothetical protein